ncbi:hypothetical protein ACN4EK_27745 [Pantanalinema rosaneae CENA516]|uniref:hypothetical protein n=1 Tax=Pantanalinema rosaneae TaxID=1620701 RepID=UPI003D6FDEE0
MVTTLIRQIVISAIWLGFSIYIVWLDPLDQPETFPIVRHLLTLHWSDVNGYLVAIFWLMGVLPMIYGCLMFTDGRMQKLPAFVYFLAANFTGILGLAPLLPLLDDDLARRGLQNSGWFWTIALLPLFGVLAYLCYRPTLQDPASPH